MSDADRWIHVLLAVAVGLSAILVGLVGFLLRSELQEIQRQLRQAAERTGGSAVGGRGPLATRHLAAPAVVWVLVFAIYGG